MDKNSPKQEHNELLYASNKKEASRTISDLNSLKSDAQYKKLTGKEQAAIAYKIAHPTATKTEAALAGGYSPATIHQSANLLFRKPKVLAILEAHTTEAEEVIKATMRNRKDKRLAFDAAKEILDRTHGKPIQRTELSGNFLNVNIDLTQSDNDT